MKIRRRRSASLLGFALFAVSAISLPAAEPAARPLFDGHDLAGWKVPAPNPWWHAADGVLVGESDDKLAGSMLWTEKSYGDFILEGEARWEGEIDSGVMMRRPTLQMQIGISRSVKKDMTGSFYISKTGYPEAGQAKEAQKYFRVGDWVAMRIEARGPVFTVSLNGHQVVQYSDAKYAGPGPIGLQIHPKLKMKVEFRNLRVTELP